MAFGRGGPGELLAKVGKSKVEVTAFTYVTNVRHCYCKQVSHCVDFTMTTVSAVQACHREFVLATVHQERRTPAVKIYLPIQALLISALTSNGAQLAQTPFSRRV